MPSPPDNYTSQRTRHRTLINDERPIDQDVWNTAGILVRRKEGRVVVQGFQVKHSKVRTHPFADNAAVRKT